MIESERVGQKERVGEILEVMDSPLGVNLRVRWDDGHESEIRPKAGSARFVAAEPSPALSAPPTTPRDPPGSHRTR